MPPPALRRSNLVLIQKKGGGEDRSGWTKAEDWTEHARAWVSINPLRGREVTRDNVTLGTVTHDIRGDWLDLQGCDNTMRVVLAEDGDYAAISDPLPFGFRSFDIVAVMRDEDNHDDVLLKVEEKRYGDGS